MSYNRYNMVINWTNAGQLAIIITIIGGIIGAISWFNRAVLFSLFKVKQNPSVEFRILKQYLGVEKEIITLSKKQLILEEEITFNAVLLIFISNPGKPTSIKFSIVTIEPNCLIDGVIAKGLKVIVQYQPNQFQTPTPMENPLNIKSDEMSESLRLNIQIPFSLSKIEKQLGSLSALKTINIIVSAEQTGRKQIVQIGSCEVLEIHRSIEEYLANRIQHCQDVQLSGVQIIQLCKRYWLGPD